MMPLQIALDANSDRVISSDEIANAPAALRKLEKNDGQFTEAVDFADPLLKMVKR